MLGLYGFYYIHCTETAADIIDATSVEAKERLCQECHMLKSFHCCRMKNSNSSMRGIYFARCLQPRHKTGVLVATHAGSVLASHMFSYALFDKKLNA